MYVQWLIKSYGSTLLSLLPTIQLSPFGNGAFSIVPLFIHKLEGNSNFFEAACQSILTPLVNGPGDHLSTKQSITIKYETEYMFYQETGVYLS